MKAVPVIVNGKKSTVSLNAYLSELFALPLPCGGHGKCGKCKVKVSGTVSEITADERACLTAEELNGNIRLACCTRVLGECTVEGVPDGTSTAAVLTDGMLNLTDLHPMFNRLGVAIDIGTTTLAARLFACDGTVLSECGCKNPQDIFGADVISRIEAALHDNGEALSEKIVSALDEMLISLVQRAGKVASDIDAVVITGNTVMLYLLTKTSVEPLSHSPFELTRRLGEAIPASVLGLTSVNCNIYIPPCISAFVGADTVCALLNSEALKASKASMLIDIGTNGEIALYNDGRLCVCSTAAGPALEGVGISMGMQGTEGAIDKVSLINGKLHSHVYGSTAPIGICGSGLVDAVAALLESELLDETGYMDEDKIEICAPVVLTRADIRSVQLAKSAICAGMKTLLYEMELDESHIEALYISGGFGNYLNKFNAGRIGLIPYSLVPKAKNIGNGALGGASMLLLNSRLCEEAEAIAKSAKTVELSSNSFFADEFIKNMLFPQKI